MKTLLRFGDNYRIFQEVCEPLEKLPPFHYRIFLDEFSGDYVLKKVGESFDVPSRLYGDTNKNADRIMKTFLDRKGSTGVLLSGEKGSGKSLLAKHVCNIGRQQGIPTLIINEPLHGDAFMSFIHSIEQPMIVFYDEFEKTHSPEDQEKLLTLLDGGYSSHVLFLLTCNDSYRINDHMINRPGRLYYFIEFSGLTKEEVREYCEENLGSDVASCFVNRIVEFSGSMKNFSFDQIKVLVEEINRYNCSLEEAVNVLNIKNRSNFPAFEVTITLGDEQISDYSHYGVEIFEEGRITVWHDEKRHVISLDDLVDANAGAGEFTFQNKDGFVMKLKRASNSRFNILDLI